MNWKALVAVALVSAGATFGVLQHFTLQREAALKAYADSVQIVSAEATARATAYADSLRRVSDSVAAAEFAAKTAVNNARQVARNLSQAVAQARTTADSNTALVALVSQQNSVITLQTLALGAADAQIAAERLRGDSLDVALNSAKRTIVDLTTHIDQLNGHALPRWARISLKAVEAGLAVRGGLALVGK